MGDGFYVEDDKFPPQTSLEGMSVGPQRTSAYSHVPAPQRDRVKVRCPPQRGTSAKVRPVPISFSNGSRGSPPILSDLRSQRVSAFSACSRALDGVSWSGATWLKPQSALVTGRMRQNRRRLPHPPSGYAPLGSSSRPASATPPRRPGTCCRAGAWHA